MVRTYKRKTDHSPPKRIDIEKAVNAIFEGLSVRKAAALYNVKRSTLQDYVARTRSKKVAQEAQSACDLCKNNGIHLLTFPPHTSHKLQPLDVAVLSPFKSALKVSFYDWIQLHPGQRINIHEIAELSKNLYINAYSPKNIISGFEKTGILPYNRNIFNETDFLSSEVTNRPLPIDQENVAGKASESAIDYHLSDRISPEQIRPLPCVNFEATNSRRGRRIKGKTRILTKSSEKKQSKCRSNQNVKPTLRFGRNLDTSVRN
ncbi:hypothetical protein AVEN_230881-1 [Araneus ventricosus]|uniref:HTH psq-type domain-containing protein n=1 Tax=Araneus ventricosus TaxID=182803 RepID=A0A4Y2A3V8_ARAVE|nr:hypothetical protein AVEN_230881-1 [Araneus ventricosus]